MKKELKWNLILLVVTLIWGAGFPIMKIGLGGIGPLWLIAIRFSLATGILAFLSRKKLRNVTKRTLGLSMIIGTTLFLVFALSIAALNYTTSTNVGFYSALAVLFTPFLSYFVNKQPIKKKVILSVVIAIAGIYLLSGSNPLGESILNKGDIMCIISSFMFAITLIITCNIVKNEDSDIITTLQLAIVAILGIISALIFEAPPAGISFESVFSIVFTAVLGTSFAMLMQNRAQREVSPAHVAIIFTMEPVFGAILSFLLLGEIIGLRGVIGGMLIVVAILISELEKKENTLNI